MMPDSLGKFQEEIWNLLLPSLSPRESSQVPSVFGLTKIMYVIITSLTVILFFQRKTTLIEILPQSCAIWIRKMLLTENFIF